MSKALPSTSESPNIALARKILLLALLIVVTAMGLLALFMQIRVASPVLSFVLIGAVMGLVAGISVRRVFGKYIVMLRVSSTMAFIVGGLSLLGWFTGWRMGIGPLIFGRDSVDWWGLGQFLFATWIAFLVLYAWRRPAKAVAPSPKSKRVRSPAKTSNRPAKRSPKARASKSPAVKGTAATPPVKTQRKRLTRRKLHLQLSREEEHRCPYCLELIEPDDPRGAVECKICHTLHHADCWAVTGACQVPHYTA